jgi:hypothetical protein
MVHVPEFGREELGVLKFDNVVLVDAVFCYLPTGEDGTDRVFRNIGF